MADFRIQFFQNFSTLLSSGVPILRAIRVIQKQSPQRYRRMFSQIETEISQGSELSDAIAKRPRRFSSMDVMLIRVGEQTGQLAEILKDMGDWYQMRQWINRTILSGFIYPVFILHFAAVTAPAPAAVIGGGWTAYVYGMLGILALFYVPLFVYIACRLLLPRKGILRRAIDSIVLSIPLIGPAIRCLAIGRYSSVFSMMYKAGIPILRCAELAPKTCGNMAIAALFNKGYEAAKTGSPMSEGFSRRLPPEFLELWAVGEESGDLDKTSAKLAQIYLDRAHFRFGLIARCLPPLVYLVIAVFIGFLIIRAFVSLYSGVMNNFMNDFGF